MPMNFAAGESKERLCYEASGIFLGVPEAWLSDHQGHLWVTEAPGIVKRG